MAFSTPLPVRYVNIYLDICVTISTYLTSAQAKLSTVAILYGYRIDRATVAAPTTARSQLHYGRGKKPPVLDDRSIGLGGVDGETVW
jgi:hypothetical protein